MGPSTDIQPPSQLRLPPEQSPPGIPEVGMVRPPGSERHPSQIFTGVRLGEIKAQDSHLGPGKALQLCLPKRLTGFYSKDTPSPQSGHDPPGNEATRRTFYY